MHESWRQNIMSILRLVVFVGLVVLLNAISISVSSMKERCMIVSTTNTEKLLKADLRFQRFADQTIEEGYRIVLHNTETHEEQAYQISEGTFRKEFQLTEHVVYRFCFKVVLSRQREIRTVMEYNADLEHRVSTLESEITVPAGLLKVEDLKKTYQSMVYFESIINQVKSTAPSIKQNQDLVFQDQNEQMKALTLISTIEIIIVIAFGAFQYFRLKGLIEAKQ